MNKNRRHRHLANDVLHEGEHRASADSFLEGLLVEVRIYRRQKKAIRCASTIAAIVLGAWLYIGRVEYQGVSIVTTSSKIREVSSDVFETTVPIVRTGTHGLVPIVSQQEIRFVSTEDVQAAPVEITNPALMRLLGPGTIVIVRLGPDADSLVLSVR